MEPWGPERMARVACALVLLALAAACSSGGTSRPAASRTARQPSTTVSSTTPTTARTVDTTSTAPPSTTTPQPPLPKASDFPPLLVAEDGSGIHAVSPTGDRVVVPIAHAETAFRLGDGSIVVLTTAPKFHRHLSRWYADGHHDAYAQYDDAVLVGIGSVDGHDNLILVESTGSGDEGVPLTLYDTLTGRVRKLGFGIGGDSGTMRASIAGGVVVQSEILDQGRGVAYTNLDGTTTSGWPDLAKGLPYPSDDRDSTMASPDGRRLVYLDGPPFAANGFDYGIPYQLVVVDRAGHELSRTTLAPARADYLDYDGRWAVISRADGEPAIIVDTASTQPRAELLPSVIGRATLDRTG